MLIKLLKYSIIHLSLKEIKSIVTDYKRIKYITYFRKRINKQVTNNYNKKKDNDDN